MLTPQPTVSDTDAPHAEGSSGPTTVVVWRDSGSPGLGLEDLLRHWADRGWRVRRRKPRVLEGPDGPTHGVLLVLVRETPTETRRHRRPIRRNAPRGNTPVRTETGA